VSYYDKPEAFTYTTRLWLSGFLAAVFLAGIISSLVFSWKNMGQEMAPLLMISALSLLVSIISAVSGVSNLEVKK
jgi:hypothetical protein